MMLLLMSGCWLEPAVDVGEEVGLDVGAGLGAGEPPHLRTVGVVLVEGEARADELRVLDAELARDDDALGVRRREGRHQGVVEVVLGGAARDGVPQVDARRAGRDGRHGRGRRGRGRRRGAGRRRRCWCWAPRWRTRSAGSMPMPQGRAPTSHVIDDSSRSPTPQAFAMMRGRPPRGGASASRSSRSEMAGADLSVIAAPSSSSVVEPVPHVDVATIDSPVNPRSRRPFGRSSVHRIPAPTRHGSSMPPRAGAAALTRFVEPLPAHPRMIVPAHSESWEPPS